MRHNNMFPPEKKKELIHSRGLTSNIPKKIDQSQKLDQSQSRQKLRKRWLCHRLNMLLKSTVYDLCTIGDRVTALPDSSCPSYELVRAGQL